MENVMKIGSFYEMNQTELFTTNGGVNWVCIGAGIVGCVGVVAAIGLTAASGGLLAPVAGSFAAACIGTTVTSIGAITVGNIL